MDVLEEQNDNLRAVLDWCRSTDAALGLILAANLIDYWDWKGHLTEGRRWLAAFLDLNPANDLPHAAALAGAGLLAWRQGDNLAARRHYEECLAMGRSMKDDKLIALALRGLADALVNLGDYGKAEALCRESLAIFRQVGDVAETAQTLSRLGNAILLQGDIPGSMPPYQESLAHYRRLGDQVGVANQLWSVGSAETIGGHHASASRYLEECLRIRESIGDELGVPYAQMMLAYANIQLRNFGDARAQYRLALPKIWDFGDRWGISCAFGHMVGLPVGEGMMEEGFRLAGAGEAVRESIGAHELPWISAVVDGWLADARRSLKPEEADRAYQEGREMTPEDAVEYVLSFLAEGGHRALSSANRQVLSRRELQVARLVAEGSTNREIAQRLFISERTVDNHVKHILEKLEFRSRSQVGAWLLAQDDTVREQPSRN
jgi:DNA-binding CsgD family transcriptional regulator